MGGVGHASRCMVVDPDGEGVRVESDRWIAKKSTLVCQEPWSPLEGTKETAEFILYATTNLEGGEKCRHEVRGELFVIVCLIVLF
jgi:hypothetical protein